jgi:hypothetical protein
MEMKVANTVRSQIGRDAFFMMGSKNLSGGANSLTFDIRGCKAWKWVKVTLDPGYKLTEMEVKGVYVEMLHNVISENTGLALTIPRIVSINA